MSNDQVSKPRHYKDYFKSSALNDSDFTGDKDTTVMIKSIQEMTLQTKDGEKVYLCAMLEGHDKPFRLNSTICKNIKKAHKTPIIDYWVGKYIAVYVQKDLKAFGELHDVLRVRPVAPKPPVISPPATPEQIKSIRDGFAKMNKDEKEYCGQAKIAKLEDLNQERAIKVINWLNGQVKK